MVNRKNVCDSGPIIHLSEIGRIGCMNLFNPVYVTSYIYDEIKAKKGPGFEEIETKVFKVVHVPKKDQKVIDIFAEQYMLSPADASVLALAHKMKAEIVFTDDLDLRDAAKKRRMIPVGTVGILIRAHRDDELSKRKLDKSLDDLLNISSLFITKELIARAKRAVK